MKYNRLTINATIILLYNYAAFVVFTQQSSKANAANDLKPTYDNVVHGVSLYVCPSVLESTSIHTHSALPLLQSTCFLVPHRSFPTHEGPCATGKGRARVQGGCPRIGIE